MRIGSVDQGVCSVIPETLLRDREVSDEAIVTFAILSMYQGLNDDAFPSLKAIAAVRGRSVSTVSHHTSMLESVQWIQKIKKGKRMRYKCLAKGILVFDGEKNISMGSNDSVDHFDGVETDISMGSQSLYSTTTKDNTTNKKAYSDTFRELKSYLETNYEHIYAAPPNFNNGKSGKAIKALAQMDQAIVKTKAHILQLAILKKDPWLTKRGYSPEVILGEWNRLVPAGSPQLKSYQRPEVKQSNGEVKF